MSTPYSKEADSSINEKRRARKTIDPIILHCANQPEGHAAWALIPSGTDLQGLQNSGEQIASSKVVVCQGENKCPSDCPIRIFAEMTPQELIHEYVPGLQNWGISWWLCKYFATLVSQVEAEN